MAKEHSKPDSKPPPKRLPTAGVIEEAKKHPGGWVYEINGNYGEDGYVPPHAIAGAWKVNDAGLIEGDFIPNPNFRKP